MAILHNVSIRNFRNIITKDFLMGPFFIIEGQNRTGKTNTLNAIHWAFTGLTLEGSKDNRSNFPFYEENQTSVLLDFGDFTFERVCAMVGGTPTTTIKLNGFEAKTVKAGEARLHAKLGLNDLVIDSPKDFNILMFLLNPLYFTNVKPSSLRQFFYKLSNTNFEAIAEQQNVTTKKVLDKYLENDPYELVSAIEKKKKEVKKIIEGCKIASSLFPSIAEEAAKKEKEEAKKLATLESDAAVADRYALAVSKRINQYYQKAMGIKVCLLEKGVGDDVYKDVCYPILPNSGLPFAAGSYAEKTYVGVRFINEVCKHWDINPLPILIDNMESLDNNTRAYLDKLGVKYIGALVK